jgi:hypothetical protein
MLCCWLLLVLVLPCHFCRSILPRLNHRQQVLWCQQSLLVLLLLLPPLFCQPQLHQLKQAQHQELWYWLQQSLLVLLLLVVQAIPCQFYHPEYLHLDLELSR